MIKIKLTFPQCDYLEKLLPRQSLCLDNCMFFINEDISDCDYWFVFENLELVESSRCSSDKIIFITGEPPAVKKYNNSFLEQFSEVITCDRNLNHSRKNYFLQGHPWFVKKSYDQLAEMRQIEKSRMLSLVVSNKILSEEHRKRYEFALQIKKYFKDKVDIYGRGILPFDDKWQVLSPYHYTICLENSSYRDYITEKLLDSFLAMTFPFYYGASNVEEYFPQGSFLNIDIRNFKEACRRIEETISCTTHYESSIEKLNQARQLCLNKYNLFFLIRDYVNSRNLGSKSKQHMVLVPEKFFINKQVGGVQGVSVMPGARIDGKSQIGSYTYVGHHTAITKANIGRYVSIGDNVSIGSGEHKLERISTNVLFYKEDPYEALTEGRCDIGDDCWIGVDSIILRNVKIGRGAVIGANSVVTKDIPSYAVAVGSPAKVIKYRFSPELIEIIEGSHWWEFDFEQARFILADIESILMTKTRG